MPVYLAKQRETLHSILWEIPDTLRSPHILILGAGSNTDPKLPPNNQLSTTTLSRLSEGIRLYRQNPDAKLIGSGNAKENRTPQARIAMNTAVTMGVHPTDTLQNTTPFNTESEALAYYNRFGNQSTVILVTSALHMPRALFWFKANGIKAIPVPTDHYVKINPDESPYHFKPSTRKIEITAAILHEWVGMLYASIKTRGSSKKRTSTR